MPAVSTEKKVTVAPGKLTATLLPTGVFGSPVGVSIVHECVAGLESTFPDGWVATAVNVYAPGTRSVSSVTTAGSQSTSVPLSVHSIVAVGSSELTWRYALVLNVVAGGPKSMKVSGAVKSWTVQVCTAGIGSCSNGKPLQSRPLYRVWTWKMCSPGHRLVYVLGDSQM